MRSRAERMLRCSPTMVSRAARLMLKRQCEFSPRKFVVASQGSAWAGNPMGTIFAAIVILTAVNEKKVAQLHDLRRWPLVSANYEVGK